MLPALYAERHLGGLQLEQEEAKDALSWGAATLSQLVWEWAVYSGHVPVRAGLKSGKRQSHAIETIGFFESLQALLQHFPVEFSIPLPPRGKGRTIPDENWAGWRYPRLRLRGSARVHLVERTTWIPFIAPPPDAEQLEGNSSPMADSNLPHFEEPSLRLAGNQQLGQVWMRVNPAFIRNLRRDTPKLFELITALFQARLEMLRARLSAASPPLREVEAQRFNAFLRSELLVLDSARSILIRASNMSARSGRSLARRFERAIKSDDQQAAPRVRPIVFVSYSHVDEKHMNAIRQHLSLIEREGRAAIWCDRRIRVGSRWSRAIASALKRARIVLLLISSSFLNSTFCYEREMQYSLKRHRMRRVAVIPVILRACHWKGADLSALKAIPKDGRPITSYRDRDKAYVQVAEAVEEALNHLSPSA